MEKNKKLKETRWNTLESEKFMFRFMIGMHTPDYDQNDDIKNWLGGVKGKGIGHRITPRKLVRLVKEIGADVFYFYAKCHQGNFYYPTDRGHMHSAFKDIDFFGGIVEECIKNDIVPAALYETLDYRIVNEKPEWCFRNSDGSVGLPCLNSPYGDFVLENLREILSNYPLYSIYMDMVDAHSSANLGTVDAHASEGVECPFCIQLYEKTTGKRYPAVSRLHSPERKEYLLWHAVNYTERFLKKAMSLRDECSPDCLVEFNFHNDLGRPWVAHSWKMSDELCGHFTCDIFAFHDGSIVDVCVPKAYRTSGSRRRSWLLEDTTQGGEQSTPKPFDFYKAELASVLSNGLDICTSIFMETDGNMDKTQATVIKKQFEYFAPLRKYYVNTSQIPFAALICPYDETTPLKGKNEYFVNREEFEGWAKMLTENQILYDVILDSFLTRETLDRYKMLIIPHCESLGRETTEAIEEWVKKGGWLIMTGYTAMRGKKGEKLKNPALHKLAGISFLSEIDVKNCYMKITDSSYINPDETITPWHYMPSGQSRISVSGNTNIVALSGEHPAVKKGKKHHLFYRHLTDYPALTERRYDSSSVFFFAGLPGQTYLNYQYKGLSDIVAKLLSPAAEGFMPVKVSAPLCIQFEASIQDKTDFLIIDLINRSGASGLSACSWRGDTHKFTYHLPHKALPVYDIRVQIKENLVGNITEIYDGASGEQISFKRSKCEVIFNINCLEAHKLLVCKRD